MVESIEPAVAALEKALAEDPHGLGDETLRQLVPVVRRAQNLLDATDTRLVGVFDARRLGDADGRIGKAQVLALTRLHSGRTAQALEDGEDYLVEHAATTDYATFEQILRAWKLAAGTEPRLLRRRFDLRRGPDGEWDGRLLAPADEGAAIDAAPHHLPRTASERRLAALMALVNRGAGSPDGTWTWHRPDGTQLE